MTDNHRIPVFVLMGVAGSGKTSIGLELEKILSCPLVEGDDYHPKCNVDKMSKGQPLNDYDRFPWLACLRYVVERHLENSDTKAVILICSALKQIYRDFLFRNLTKAIPVFVYLDGSRELLLERLEKRQGHFMGAKMLDSQLADLEIPSEHQLVRVKLNDEKQPLDVANEINGLISKYLKG
ncbi:uncharacterized protein VTP21DRAFT_2079 [Calcarisporiella thermophila]|uniref:uncharacterized protein n=1 Tax=Calcarisporiella thermophila TaxID=911321 RepID=UPI003743430B